MAYKVQILISMIWYFNVAMGICALMYDLLGEHKIIWTSYNIIRVLKFYLFFVLLSILFLTLNYVCETVYNKV